MSIILNKEALATNDLRRDALEILEAGLQVVATEKILRKKISVKDGILNIDGYFLNLKSFERVFFVGIGKCGLDGARIIENILGDYLTRGAIIDVREAAAAEALASRGKIKYFQGTHPLPSQQNVEATKEILAMVKDLTEKDLVLTLISGGGSALFELPDEAATAKLGLPGETSLETVIRITKELTAAGADIYELNKVRKEMSQVKGGKFAQSCFPAQVASLLFSDVLGNDISVIASGPTVVEDPSAPAKNILLVSNIDALEAMESKAKELGYDATIETDRLSGNASEVGKDLALREPKLKTCILMGGETTVKISENPGIGGRNQELALSALRNIAEGALLISVASDGWDNTEHAGALADTEFLEKAKNLNLNPQEFLERSDSFNFWKLTGGGISTGRLGSNVSDLYILIYK